MTIADAGPLLSLVVPTRNRQKYAISLLQGVQAFDAPELEVIVQDNSDDSTLQEFVSGLSDPRIRYFYCAEPLTMHQNFDRAIDKARGEYVCAIGDDDGIIIPAALASLRQAKAIAADAILTEIYAYSWPGVEHPIWGNMGGRVFTRRAFPRAKVGLIDPRVELEKLYARGSVGGLGLLPRVYHGYVSRESLRKLMEACGTYFPGSSPDMANAVALVPFVKTMYFDTRFTLISGHSPNSGGGQGSRKQHHAELEQANLPAATITNWDPRIPRFWSGTTIYAQSVMEAARAVNLTPHTPFNYAKLYIACQIYEPSLYRQHITAALASNATGDLQLKYLFAREYISMVVHRAKIFLSNLGYYVLGVGKLGAFSSIKHMMIRLQK